MNLRVNGQPREMPDGASLQDLLESLDAATVGTAVARNGEVVPRERHGDTALSDGDEIEIVHIVAGG
jgi:sulfur carrier protein